jgi:O-antigen/teichoic acid export membrane protein
MALSLRRNAAWTFLGQVVFAACHWVGFIIIGRLGGPEELGRYAFALALVTPIMLFAGLQMRELQVADATQRYRFDDYFAVRLAGAACAGLILLTIALLGYAWPIAVAILLVALARGFESLSEVHYGLAHRHRRLDLVAQSTMLRGVLELLALGVGYYLTRDLAVALIGLAVTRASVWWFFDRAKTRQWRHPAPAPSPQPTLKRRLGLAWTALPLGIAMLLVTLNPNVPRYFIEASAGLAALGLFTSMAHFVVAGRMVVTAVSQAAFPRLADLHAEGDRAGFRWLLIRLIAVSALPGSIGLLVALAFGRELLSLVYGSRFADGADVFPWIMLVGVVLYAQTPFGYGLTATQRIKIQPLVFGITVAVNVVGCVLLVPGYGIWGATLAWLASVTCQFVLSAILHWRYLRRPDKAGAKPAEHAEPRSEHSS